MSAEDAMTDNNITKDAMYGAVAPDDFESMIELDRYEQRSTAFDKIISATRGASPPISSSFATSSRGRVSARRLLLQHALAGGTGT